MLHAKQKFLKIEKRYLHKIEYKSYKFQFWIHKAFIGSLSLVILIFFETVLIASINCSVVFYPLY